MSNVVLDFEAAVLDGLVAGHVPYLSFDETGVSAIYAVTARALLPGKTREAPNDITNYSPDIRLSLDGVTFGDWGESLPAAFPLPFVVYVQFRRAMTGLEVAYTDALYMADDRIIDLPGNHGSGYNVSYGSGSGAQKAPGSGSGYNVSYGGGSTSAASSGSGSGYNVSSGSGAGTAIPADCFTDDYSTGKLLNTAEIDAVGGGGGSVAVYDTNADSKTDVLQTISAAATDYSIWRIKKGLDTNLNRRHTVNAKQRSASTAIFPLFVMKNTTLTADAFDAARRIVVTLDADGDIMVRYWAAGHASKSYFWTGVKAGTWDTTAGSPDEYLSATENTEYKYALETDYNAGGPRWRIVIKSADGTTTLGTTAWVDWATLESYYPCYVGGGDPYTSVGTGSMHFSLVKVEAI